MSSPIKIKSVFIDLTEDDEVTVKSEAVFQMADCDHTFTIREFVSQMRGKDYTDDYGPLSERILSAMEKFLRSYPPMSAPPKARDARCPICIRKIEADVTTACAPQNQNSNVIAPPEPQVADAGNDVVEKTNETKATPPLKRSHSSPRKPYDLRCRSRKATVRTQNTSTGTSSRKEKQNVDQAAVMTTPGSPVVAGVVEKTPAKATENEKGNHAVVELRNVSAASTDPGDMSAVQHKKTRSMTDLLQTGEPAPRRVSDRGRKRKFGPKNNNASRILSTSEGMTSENGDKSCGSGQGKSDNRASESDPIKGKRKNRSIQVDDELVPCEASQEGVREKEADIAKSSLSAPVKSLLKKSGKRSDVASKKQQVNFLREKKTQQTAFDDPSASEFKKPKDKPVSTSEKDISVADRKGKAMMIQDNQEAPSRSQSQELNDDAVMEIAELMARNQYERNLPDKEDVVTKKQPKKRLLNIDLNKTYDCGMAEDNNTTSAPPPYESNARKMSDNNSTPPPPPCVSNARKQDHFPLRTQQPSPSPRQPVLQQPSPQRPSLWQPVLQQTTPQQPSLRLPVLQQPTPQQHSLGNPSLRQPVLQQPTPQQQPYLQQIYPHFLPISGQYLAPGQGNRDIPAIGYPVPNGQWVGKPIVADASPMWQSSMIPTPRHQRSVALEMNQSTNPNMISQAPGDGNKYDLNLVVANNANANGMQTCGPNPVNGGRSSTDSYANQSSVLLSLMNPGGNSQTPAVHQGNTTFTKRHFPPAYQVRSFFENQTGESSKSAYQPTNQTPLNFVGNRFVPETSSRTFPNMQATGMPSFPFQNSVASGSNQVNLQENLVFASGSNQRSRQENSLFASGSNQGNRQENAAFASSSNQMRFRPLGLSNSMIHPLRSQMAEADKEQTHKRKAETSNNNASVLPPPNVSAPMVCVINRNPADFTIPEPGNIYMIDGESLNAEKRTTYQRRSTSCKQDASKRAKYAVCPPSENT